MRNLGSTKGLFARRVSTASRRRHGYLIEDLEQRTMLSQTASVQLQIPGEALGTNYVGPIQDGLSTQVNLQAYPTSAESPDNVVNTITGSITVEWYGGKTLGTTTVTASVSDFTSTSTFNPPTYTLNVADAGPAITTGPYVGDYVLFAVYSGDSNFSPTSPVLAADYAQVVAGSNSFPDNVEPTIVQFQLSIGVTVQPGTTAPGAAITPAPQVTVYNANGTIDTSQQILIDASLDSSSTGTGTLSEFRDFDTVDGVATFTGLSISTAGEYVLDFTDQLSDVTTSAPFAVTTGGGNGGGSTTTTSLAVAVSSASIAFGGNEILTATITPASSGSNAVSGTVTFKLANGTSLGSSPVSDGIASLAISSLPVGDDLISAIYSGDSHFSTSSTTTAAAVNVTSSGSTGSTGTLPTTITKNSLPTDIVAGTKVHGAFSVAVRNTAAAVSFQLDNIVVYASVDGAIDSSSTLLTSLRRKLKIAAGASTNVPLPAKNLTLPAGSYTLLVQTTDPTGATSISTSGPVVTVSPAQVILAGTAGAVKPTTVTAGKSASLTLTLTNTGNVKASGKMTIAIGLSADGETLAIPLTTVTKSVTVNPGGKPAKLPLSFRVPKTTAPGTYYPYFVPTQGTAELTVVGTVPFTIG